MSRKEYLPLFEKLTAATKKHGKSSSKRHLSPLTGQEQRRLDELEEELPLQAIVMFRTMARKEVRPRLLPSSAGYCGLLFWWSASLNKLRLVGQEPNVFVLSMWSFVYFLIFLPGTLPYVAPISSHICSNRKCYTTPKACTYLWRQMIRQLKRKRDEEKAKRGGHDKESDDKKGGGWWSNLWGGDDGDDTPVQEEGDVAIKDLSKGIDDDAESKKVRMGGKQRHMWRRTKGGEGQCLTLLLRKPFSLAHFEN